MSMGRIKLVNSDTHLAQQNNFTALATKFETLNDVQIAYRKVCRLHPAADYVVGAYNLAVTRTMANWVMQIIEISARKTLTGYCGVFWYRHNSGIHLGPNRFQRFKEVVNEALARLKTSNHLTPQ